MAKCPRCKADGLIIIRHGSEVLLNCTCCHLVVAGNMVGGFLIPHHDHLPIINLRGEPAHEATR